MEMAAKDDAAIVTITISRLRRLETSTVKK